MQRHYLHTCQKRLFVFGGDYGLGGPQGFDLAVFQYASLSMIVPITCRLRDASFCVELLEEAIARYGKPEIMNTDRGSQYFSHDYQKILRRHGFKASMCGKGNCYDNAAVDVKFKTIKAELIWQDTWEIRRQAELAIFEYINGYYNPRRRHSTLVWKCPVAFERKVA